jgi:hypothetical protein
MSRDLLADNSSGTYAYPQDGSKNRWEGTLDMLRVKRRVAYIRDSELSNYVIAYLA